MFCVFDPCGLLGPNNQFLVAGVSVLPWTSTGLAKGGAALLPMLVYFPESNSSASAARGKSRQDMSCCPFVADGAAARPVARLPVTHLCSQRELALGKSCCAFQIELALAAAQEFCMNFDCAFTPKYSVFQWNCAGVM